MAVGRAVGRAVGDDDVGAFRDGHPGFAQGGPRSRMKCHSMKAGVKGDPKKGKKPSISAVSSTRSRTPRSAKIRRQAASSSSAVQSVGVAHGDEGEAELRAASYACA